MNTSGMRRLAFVLLSVVSSIWAANVKLYLKDGSHHIVREYKVEGDRVRFYSVERSDWEQIPLELVDLKRTEAETAQRKQTLAEEAKVLAAEEKVERELQDETSKIPQNPGVYQLTAKKELLILHLAESKVHGNKRRSILKAMSPIPIFAGKATLELDQPHATYVVNQDRPEFYIQLSAEERFGIFRLTPKDGIRIVEKLTIIPISKEIVEESTAVEVFRKQMDGNGLYKIWPVKALEPGEYAVVQYTEGKLNIQVWDFRYDPSAKDIDPKNRPPIIVEK